MTALTVRPARFAPALRVLAILTAVALAGCSASTSSLPASAPTVRTSVEPAAATCTPSTAEVTLTLDEQPLRVVENSGSSVPTNRLELSGRVTNLPPRSLYAIAVGADAACPFVEVVRLEVYSDGPWRAGFRIADGLRLFVVASDATSAAAFACTGACVDAGTDTIFGISESVVVHLE